MSFSKINALTLIILNIVYLGLLVFMSRGYIDIFSHKEILFVTDFDHTFFSGDDAIYGLRFIRLILKSLSFAPVGLFFVLIKNKKYFTFSGGGCVFFIVNLATLITFQIIFLDVITVNIYNYILYFSTYVIAIFISKYITNKCCLGNWKQ